MKHCTHSLAFLRSFGPLSLPPHGTREPWQSPYDKLVTLRLAEIIKSDGFDAYAIKPETPTPKPKPKPKPTHKKRRLARGSNSKVNGKGRR